MKKGLVLGGLGVLVLGSIGAWWCLVGSVRHVCDFSETIRNNASMQLYCFDDAKLPGGVTSDSSKAVRQDSAVIYSAKDGNTTIAVSLQKNPGGEKVTTFVEKVIPLHLETTTPLGKAQTGVSGEQTITSLPTSSDTWIIATTPKDYATDKLTQILQAFRKD